MKRIALLILCLAAFPAFAAEETISKDAALESQEAPPTINGRALLEKDPCIAWEWKKNLAGSYAITGRTLPNEAGQRETYAGTAVAEFDELECILMIKRCVGKSIETGELKKTLNMEGEYPLWRAEITSQIGEKRIFLFKMGDPDGNPFLVGGPEDRMERWHKHPDAACQ